MGSRANSSSKPPSSSSSSSTTAPPPSTSSGENTEDEQDIPKPPSERCDSEATSWTDGDFDCEGDLPGLYSQCQEDDDDDDDDDDDGGSQAAVGAQPSQASPTSSAGEISDLDFSAEEEEDKEAAEEGEEEERNDEPEPEPTEDDQETPPSPPTEHVDSQRPPSLPLAQADEGNDWQVESDIDVWEEAGSDEDFDMNAAADRWIAWQHRRQERRGGR